MHQRIGVGHRPSLKVGQHHTKGAQRNADAQNQNQHRREGKAGGIAEHAGAVCQILMQTIEPSPAPHLARVLAQAQFVAEIRAAVRRHQLAMVGHLLCHLAFQTAAVPQVRNTSQQFHHHHWNLSGDLQASFKTAWMARFTWS